MDPQAHPSIRWSPPIRLALAAVLLLCLLSTACFDETPGPTAAPSATAAVTATPTRSPTPTPETSPTWTPDPSGTRIRDVQGRAHRSPIEGQRVEKVPGIVTAVTGNGFWMQDLYPDDDNATSEGVFVFTSRAPEVEVGDEVLVNGNVNEYRPGEEAGSLTITEIAQPSLLVRSIGNDLPAPTLVGAGGRQPPAAVIDDDASGSVEQGGSFDADADGIDFYESLEGMRVQVNDALVVGPTNSYGETWVVGDGGVSASSLTARGGIYITQGDANPERIQLEDTLYAGTWPELNVGARFSRPVIGVLHYGYNNYELYVTEPLVVDESGQVTPERTLLLGTPDRLTVATLNVENLGGDAPASAFAARAAIIVDNLASPDIVALEEMQDNNGAESSGGARANETFERLIAAIQDAGGPAYRYTQIDPVSDADGGEPGGNIRIGFLYDPARVELPVRSAADARTANTVICTAGQAALEYNPGRVDPRNTAFSDSRKPLAAEYAFGGETFFIIGVHFNSKGGDDPLYGRRQPPVLHSQQQRLEQAQAVNDFVDQILACDPNANVIVLGDTNDFQFSAPIAALQGAAQGDVLYNLMDLLPPNEQYSYVYEGNSQVLDQMLVSENVLDQMAPEYDVVHVNAEFRYAVQVSDHDPAVVGLTIP